MLHKVVLNFKSVDETLVCDQSRPLTGYIPRLLLGKGILDQHLFCKEDKISYNSSTSRDFHLLEPLIAKWFYSKESTVLVKTTNSRPNLFTSRFKSGPTCLLFFFVMKMYCCFTMKHRWNCNSSKQDNNRQTDRWTDRQTDGQTDRQTLTWI